MSPTWQSSRELALNVFLTISISSTCIWLTTSFAALFWRRASAAIRHRLWGASMVAVIIAPVLICFAPIPRIVPARLFSFSETAHSLRETTAALEVTPMTYSGSSLVTACENQCDDSVTTNQTRLNALQQVPTVTPGGLTAARSSEESSERPTSVPGDASPVIVWRPGYLADGIGTAVVGAWLIGMVISAVCFIVSLRQASQWLRSAIVINTGREVEQCQTLCRQLMIQLPISVRVSLETPVALTSGIVRPIVVLPMGVGNWSQERLHVVLAHELMHVHRFDVLWQVIGRFCLIPAWFHPLGWLAYAKLHVECEHACDDAVILNGQAPADYASYLVETAAEIRQHFRRIPPHVVAMAKHNPVESRVRAILDASIARDPLDCLLAWNMAAVMLAMILMSATISPGFGAPSSKAVVSRLRSTLGDELQSQKLAGQDRGQTGEEQGVKQIGKAANDPASKLSKDVAAPQDASKANWTATDDIAFLRDHRKSEAGAFGRQTDIAADIVSIIRKSTLAIGHIQTEKVAPPKHPGDKPVTIKGFGTSFMIDERGYLVTSWHVIDDASSIRVGIEDENGVMTSYKARAICHNQARDIAIIKIDSPMPFKALTMGTSSHLKIGQGVIAIGNALGRAGTTTFGVISSLGRQIDVNETVSYKNLIMVDAAMYPGSSGGPLINSDGEVIGIVVAIRAGSRKIGFAIPIDDARRILDDLISTHKLEIEALKSRVPMPGLPMKR